jgi:outer membrane protein OmpA-like peptidoglycan-associated protein
MMNLPTAERKSADSDRRPAIPSMIVRKSGEPEFSGANALRQRVGNQGIQRLVGEMTSASTAAPGKAPGRCADCEEEKKGEAQTPRKEGTAAMAVGKSSGSSVAPVRPGPAAKNVAPRAGDPRKIPAGLRCPTDLTGGKPAGTDLLFAMGADAITPAHTAKLTAFRATWLAAGGTDDIVVHGYASTIGEDGANWTLSCDRAEAVRAELIRLGIPAVRISVLAHGESTDFGPGLAANQHAIVSTRASILPLPLTAGVLSAADNFAGRSITRFGVGEVINLSFFSFPARPAADFGGLDWVVAGVGGAITPPAVVHDGTGIYTAPATPGAVTLELRVAGGATAGRVVSRHAIAIVAPSDVRMTDVPGTAPNFSPSGPIPAGRWGAGFRANIFIDPKDVSFRGIVFTEDTTRALVVPPGSFLSGWAGFVHVAGVPLPGGGGNLATGTQLVGFDQVFSGSLPPRHTFPFNICGDSQFFWFIPWRYSVAGGAPVPFRIVLHHSRSTPLCDAFIQKAGAGPFKRST